MLPTDFEKFLVSGDRPSEQDYIYEDHFDGEQAEGKGPIWDKETLKIWDQYDQKDTYKACTCYGLGGIFNGFNLAEYAKEGFKYEQQNPRWKWKPFQELRGYPNKGSNLQEMMKFYKKMGWIEGWLRIDTMQGAKNVLNNGLLIYTGTNRCDWRKAGATGKFVKKINGGGHAFYIVGYNDEGFIACNSFGDDWGDDGYFTIPFENYNDLFSKNAIIDKDDTGKLSDLNYEREKREAIELGITNGTRPTEPVTREEASVMALRASKLKE